MEEKNKNIRLELQEKLKIIGWYLQPCGCDHYRIHNNKKNPTYFLYRHGEIRDESGPYKKPFGQEMGGGGFIINLEKCDIEILRAERADPFVSIISKTDDHKQPALFISFYKID